MNTYSMLRDRIGSLAGISSATGHDTWRKIEVEKGERKHRYKQVPFASSERREAYAKALAWSGVMRDEGSGLPALVTTKSALPESVIAKDGLGKLKDEDSVIDILAIPGKSLPEERLEAEGKATSLKLEDVIHTAMGKGYTSLDALITDKETIEVLADREHERWMQFNSYLKDSQPDCFVPYSQLSEAEKQKDRDAIHATIATLTDALNNIDKIAKVGL